MSSRKSKLDPLAMQIYAAILGGSPRVSRNPPTQSRLKVQFEMKREVVSPFNSPTLKQTIERAAAGAVTALNDAGDRLRRSRARVQPPAPMPTRAPMARPTPIVLIGGSRSGQKSPPTRSAAA